MILKTHFSSAAAECNKMHHATHEFDEKPRFGRAVPPSPRFPRGSSCSRPTRHCDDHADQPLCVTKSQIRNPGTVRNKVQRFVRAGSPNLCLLCDFRGHFTFHVPHLGPPSAKSTAKVACLPGGTKWNEVERFVSDTRLQPLCFPCFPWRSHIPCSTPKAAVGEGRPTGVFVIQSGTELPHSKRPLSYGPMVLSSHSPLSPIHPPTPRPRRRQVRALYARCSPRS